MLGDLENIEQLGNGQTRMPVHEMQDTMVGATETEIAKLGEQAQREIANAAKTAKHELRQYTAEQSVRLAEDIIRREMKPEDDARLISRDIAELGGPPQ